MTKKGAFGTKPAPAVTPAQWVDSRSPDTGAGERTKRLTIDVPMKLNVRIKAQCALRGTKMADESGPHWKSVFQVGDHIMVDPADQQAKYLNNRLEGHQMTIGRLVRTLPL